MNLKRSTILGALGLVIAFSTAEVAYAASNQARSDAQKTERKEASRPSAEELNAFTQVYSEVQQARTNIQANPTADGTPRTTTEMDMELDRKTQEIVENQDRISSDRYHELARKMETDPQFRQQVEERVGATPTTREGAPGVDPDATF